MRKGTKPTATEKGAGGGHEGTKEADRSLALRALLGPSLALRALTKHSLARRVLTRPSLALRALLVYGRTGDRPLQMAPARG